MCFQMERRTNKMFGIMGQFYNGLIVHDIVDKKESLTDILIDSTLKLVKDKLPAVLKYE